MKIIQIQQTQIGLAGLSDDGKLYVWNGIMKVWEPA